MTAIRPYLFINRLVILTHTGSTAYDERFHLGVNIIRGNNSSGKSTIANFIFYGLGGDFSNWTTQALLCREVYIEVNINETILTLNRNIAENGQQPLNIYWGSYEQAVTDRINWKAFPYRQTENKISFTRVIFDVLGFPEVRTEADSNITMHQLLRLMYVDQDSPTQSIFRFERFDIPLTRLTVAEVLLGTYDDALYNDRVSLREAQKTYEDKKRQFDAISRMFSHTGSETTVSSIEKEITAAKNDLDKIEVEIGTLKSQNRVRTTTRTSMEIERIHDQLAPAKAEVNTSRNYIDELELDIFDSKQFIGMLEKRIYELDNTITTKKVFSTLEVTHCPQCLSPLEQTHEDTSCSLCKQILSKEKETTYASRMRQELQLQLKESKSLLVSKERKLDEESAKYIDLTQKARRLQRQLDIAIADSQSTRDDRIDQMLVEKGIITQKLEDLNQQLRTVTLLESLKKELLELETSIEKLKSSINAGKKKQQQNSTIVYNKIQNHTLDILRKDLDRQDEFKIGRNVDIDFNKDTFSLDGSNSFSASSNIYFKNAIHFAIFFASLELDFMRYPKFILCDNMEDKGMEKVRTQNFQNVIADISSKIDVAHQIIFTTSMVSDELNNTPLCVGDEYSPTNKTLKV